MIRNNFVIYLFHGIIIFITQNIKNFKIFFCSSSVKNVYFDNFQHNFLVYTFIYKRQGTNLKEKKRHSICLNDEMYSCEFQIQLDSWETVQIQIIHCLRRGNVDSLILRDRLCSINTYEPSTSPLRIRTLVDYRCSPTLYAFFILIRVNHVRG